jgi:hypothetical protein
LYNFFSSPGGEKCLGNLSHFNAEPPNGEAKKAVKNEEYSIVLAVVDDFRTFEWMEMVKYPELVLQQSRELLQTI